MLQRVLQRPVSAEGVEETLTQVLAESGTAEEFFGRVAGCYERAQRESAGESLMSQILKQAALGLVVPDLFGLRDLTTDTAGEVFGRVCRTGKMHVLISCKVLETLLSGEEDEAFCAAFTRSLVTSLVDEVVRSGRRNASLSSCGEGVGEVNLLVLFLTQISNAQVVRRLGECICSEDNLSRLLVSLLQPSLTDHVFLYNDRPSLLKTPKHQYFSRLSRTSVNEVTAAQSQLRSLQNGNVELVLTLLNRLLRTSEPARQAVMATLGRLVCGDRAWQRSTIGWQQQFTPHAIGLYEHLFKPESQLNGSLERFRALMHLTKPNNISSGLAVNVASLIFELILPIKSTSLATAPIGVSFLLDAATTPKILGAMLQEARMAPKEAVAVLAAAAGGAATAGGSFKEGIFWLGVSAVHSLLLPALKEAETCVQVASLLHRDQKPEAQLDDAYGEWQCFDTLLLNTKLLQSVGHLLNLTMMVVLKCATGKPALADWLKLDVCSEAEGGGGGELDAVPCFVVEDVIELLVSYQPIFEAGRQPESLLTSQIEPEVYIVFLVYILGSDVVKNPQIRGKAASVLHSLMKTDSMYSHRLREMPFCTRNILPACIRVFTAVEKTKQSFYDIRFHVKFQLRMPIQKLFERMLSVSAHRQALVLFATHTHQDEFVKFVNQLLNDTAYLLDEGLDTLLRIRKGPVEGMAPETAEPPAAPPGEAEDEPSNSRSVQDPKEHCKVYMKLARQTLSTLHAISKESSVVIVENRVLLEQLITSCVDPVLDRLVGPRALELKGRERDFEIYEFDPKYLLNKIGELYVFLQRPNEERVRRIVGDDLRYYKPETFRKAVNILRREKLLTAEMLKEFERFVLNLNEYVTKQKNALDSVTIPDEYLDPLMASIMTDPVLLPTSGIVMDRSVITRIILSDDHDPFNREPLSLAQLQPQDELRRAIVQFCADNHIELS